MADVGKLKARAMFFISALTGTGPPPGGPQKVYLIVPRSCAYLADMLTAALGDRADMKVIVDRRSRERRTRQLSVRQERRQAQRRRPKEAMVEVVVEGIGLIKETDDSPA